MKRTPSVTAVWLVLAAISTPAATFGASVPPPPAPDVRPIPPTRSPTAPGAPALTAVGGQPGEMRGAPGQNAPVDADGDFLIGPDYRPAPELNVIAGVPVGKVRQFTLDSRESKFYHPGIAIAGERAVDPKNPRTVIVQTRAIDYQRTITVYVPNQYAAGSAAPFIVTHDGPPLGRPDPTLPQILDNLIAQRRVPAMVAIMVAHGGGDAQGSERGREYDTMSGKYAEFIEAEVLPRVEANCGVKLTRDPDGRATMGNSSGAAAALIMAWYHPEWYRRVISYSGTFVNQQWPYNPETPGGAWDFHARLIPQSPRRPIRLWMEVGDRDYVNPNVMRDGMHDWVEANHRMAAVLKAKGYHYQYIFALNAGHGDRAVRNQTLPQALEWVWRGYPVDPVR